MKVAFEADIKTAATPVVMSATALLKALGDLLTAIDAQIVPATIPTPTSPAPKRSFLREDPAPAPPAASGVLLVRGDVVVLINYAKLINFVVGDILKLSADTTITTARDFGVLMADVAAVLKYIMISKPEMSAKNIDDGTRFFILN